MASERDHPARAPGDEGALSLFVFAYEAQLIPGLGEHPPLPPGKGLKFVVEDPATGNRSSTWRIWTGKTTDDVYICETESGGEWKTSLHNDWGKWRVAMTSDAARTKAIPRVVLTEQERRAPGGDGWSEGVALLTPCSDLRPSSEPIPVAVIRVPTTPSHSAIGVRLLLQEHGSTTYTRLDDGFGIGVLVRPNGGAVYVVAQPTSLKRELIESMATTRSDARSASPSGTRFVGVIVADEEQQILVDLAL